VEENVAKVGHLILKEDVEQQNSMHLSTITEQSKSFAKKINFSVNKD
jgi:hypothetical protein